MREIAGLLGVDPRTVRLAIQRGTLRAIRLGPRGAWRIPVAEVERLLGEGRRP